MFTKENLEAANKALETVGIEKTDKKTGKKSVKQYAMVTERIKAFRSICPAGAIVTEILNDIDGVVTIKATISDENGAIIATGIAQEKESASFINKTSYIENCETSAVGRALGFLGFGCDDSLASAEEVKNAIEAQDTIKAEEKKAETLNAREVKAFRKWIAENGIDESKLCAGCKVESLEQLTLGKYRNILDNADKAKEAWT